MTVKQGTPIFAGSLLWLMFVTAWSQTAEQQMELKADPAPIKLMVSKPPAGTPQAIMVDFILLREEGKREEAMNLISSDTPDWLRDSLLKRGTIKHGPIKLNTFIYQLEEYTEQTAQVSIDYSHEDGTFIGWSRGLIRQGGRWVLE